MNILLPENNSAQKSKRGKENFTVKAYIKTTTWNIGVTVMKMMRQIRDSLLYIDNHLEEPITVSSIADAAGYSEYHFSRCFRQEMQMSVMEYVRKRRLIKAS